MFSSGTRYGYTRITSASPPHHKSYIPFPFIALAHLSPKSKVYFCPAPLPHDRCDPLKLCVILPFTRDLHHYRYNIIACAPPNQLTFRVCTLPDTPAAKLCELDEI